MEGIYMEFSSYLKKQMQKRMNILTYKKVNWYLIDESSSRFTYLNHSGEIIQYFDGDYVYVSDKFKKADAVWTIENMLYRQHMNHMQNAFN